VFVQPRVKNVSCTQATGDHHGSNGKHFRLKPKRDLDLFVRFFSYQRTIKENRGRGKEKSHDGDGRGKLLQPSGLGPEATPEMDNRSPLRFFWQAFSNRRTGNLKAIKLDWGSYRFG